jgi:hypothetical protein
MITKHSLLKAATVVVLLLGFKLALATVPPTLNYQAFLTDNNAVPINGPVTVTFAIYNVDVGGGALWAEVLPVTVNNGVLSVELGNTVGFPPGLFEAPLWIGIAVGADPEMTPRKPITSTGFAFKAGDADTLEGVSAASLDQSAHVGDTSNPHNVTAAQTGAASTGDLTAHEGDPSAHHVKTTTFPELTGQASDGQIPSLIARDSEIMPKVLANDGPGSTLNADLLDGLHASSFMPVGTDLWVNITGDTMTGALTVPSFTIDGNSTTFIKSGGDIRIHDDINGFRWYDTAGTDQFAYFFISNSLVRFQDANTNRALLYSNADGIGIGTTTPVTTQAVTVPSLNVTDDISAGNAGIGALPSSTYKLNVLNENTTSWAYGMRSEGTAYDAASAYGAYGGLFYGRGSQNGGTTYGVYAYSRAYGSSNSYGVYSSATGGTTTGTEYAFYGIGQGYFSDDLTSNGDYITVRGNGAEQAYIGGDGAGADVQVGSNNASITAVALWNRNTGARMDLHARQIHIYGGADLAEPFNFSDEVDVEPGTIVSIDPEQPGLLKVSEQAYDRMVAGIVSGAKGIEPGVKMVQEGTEMEGSVSVALTGRVYALVDTKYGAIEPGDMLTTSDTPGYAMKVTDHAKSQGSIIGKAMSPLKEGKGHVLVLVTLQ